METRKKKIVFLITKSNWGGAQRYVYDLATTLDPVKYDVTIVVGGKGELYDQLRAAGMHTISLPSLTRDISLMKEIHVFVSLLRILRKEKPDVLHVNSSKAGAIGTLLGRLLRIRRIVFTAHGWAFNEDRPTWQLFAYKCIHWLTILQSHHTIAVSHAIKQQMQWPLVQKKISVINPGRSIPELYSKSDARGILETKVVESVANLSAYDNDLWIGTIAELHPIKRLSRAIDAVSSLSRSVPNVRYIIIGDGQCMDALRQQVHNLGMHEHIYFTGFRNDAARYLPAFDVFVLPSASEAFGYVLLEAGIAGVPVVATNVGGIPDIIRTTETGLLVEPDNTPALTDALRTILTDEAYRQQLAEAHQAHASTYTIEKMLALTVAVYQN